MDFKNKYERYWKKFICSFKYAWSGIKHVVRHEQNMKFHLFVGFIIIVLAVVLNIPLHDKLILLVVIGMVISLEAMNTAIERVVDLVTQEYQPLAKAAKDVAAGAVLIFSFFAVIIGVFIFYKPVFEVIVIFYEKLFQ